MNSPIQSAYPWADVPFIVCAPMLKIALAPLAVAVTRAGGIGFLAGGTDLSDLDRNLQHAKDLIQQSIPSIPHEDGVLPIGVGFLNHSADLNVAVDVVKKYTPAAVWMFAPRELSDLVLWTDQIREASGKTRIWIQIGTKTEAMEVTRLCKPDVLVVQGSDAGGHGLKQSASILTVLPEVSDALAAEGLGDLPLFAAGGLVEGRGMAAALTLGASGVVMGTRFLASKEAQIAKGYQDEVLRATDGGVSTVRTTVYDAARGTTGWPQEYDGRGLINDTYRDDRMGMAIEENRKLYANALNMGERGWGPQGRMTTYAGTGVGLIREVLPAEEIVKEVAKDARKVLERTSFDSPT